MYANYNNQNNSENNKNDAHKSIAANRHPMVPLVIAVANLKGFGKGLHVISIILKQICSVLSIV